MAQQTLTARLKQKYDAATNWTTNNPVLLAGELGFESDTGKFKIGDGTTAWNSLSYVSTGSGGAATDVQINGTSITNNNVANIRTNGTYNSSTNKIATMSDLPSAITEISTQYIRITDLETGVYKLTYNGTKYIYYHGKTSTSTLNITGGSGAVILTVNRFSDIYWHWYYINGTTGYETIYFGYTSSSVGATSSKPLNSLLTSISSYVKNNLDYSTSNTTYALSAYQGHLLNQNKQDKLPTSSTAGQVLKSTSTAGTVEWGTVTPTLPSDVAYFAEESGTPSVALPYYTKNEIDSLVANALVDSKGTKWIRYDNGIQICWGTQKPSSIGSSRQSISFPQPFIDTNYSLLTTGVYNGSPYTQYIVEYTSNNSQMTQRTTSGTEFNGTLSRSWMAIGYWK